MQESNEEKTFPLYRCGSCKRDTQLEFDPTKEKDKFDKFECPNCKKNNRIEPR